MSESEVVNIADVQGLRSFARDLGKVDKGFQKQVKEANYDAARSIRDKAREIAAGQGGVARKAAMTGLRASRSASYGAVTLGGARAPYAFGAEFGALKYKRFKPWLGNRFTGWDGGPGYFLHPAIRENAATVLDTYWKRIEQIAAEAFPE